MKLKEIKVERFFKRFTKLTVQGIPETARLIMLAGPNGCGKSSFFDALNLWYAVNSGWLNYWTSEYNLKEVQSGIDVPPILEENRLGTILRSGLPYVGFHDYEIDEVARQNNRKVFRIRSAYRNDPEFRIKHFERVGSSLDDRKEQQFRMVDNDAAVARNYQRLVSQAVGDIFVGSAETTAGQLRKRILGDIQKALLRLFPDLKLNSLGDPLNDSTFRFTKGASQGFEYMNLSGGEKAAFDLILDLVIARREYNNTVFCIDEPESHMNASLQAELLSVLYDLVPGNCQLMLATHSIGMMRRARDIEAKNPGSVTFLDFGGRDFDRRQVIEPTVPDRAFWNRVYDVALEDLAKLVAPERVVICEGTPKGTESVRNHSHDARCYDRIFETEFPETKFVSMGNDGDVIEDKRGLAKTLGLLIKELKIIRLVDRDARSPEEVADLKNKGVRVLSRRNLECYLFDDEVLQALAKSVGKEDKANGILAVKATIMEKNTMEKKVPSDDLKSASGELYNECKRILSLTQCGNNTETFMRDTLASLVTPEMKVYEELRRDIFGSH